MEKFTNDVENPVLKRDVFVSIIKDKSKQEAFVNAAIFREVLKLYKQDPQNQKINKLWMRSDQAGCYMAVKHLTALWSLQKVAGVDIKGYLFSEPGSGKGPCDQFAAICKHKVKRSLDAGFDATDPHQFANCMVRNDGISNVTVMVGSVDQLTPTDEQLHLLTKQLKNITDFNR